MARRMTKKDYEKVSMFCNFFENIAMKGNYRKVFFKWITHFLFREYDNIEGPLKFWKTFSSITPFVSYCNEEDPSQSLLLVIGLHLFDLFFWIFQWRRRMGNILWRTCILSFVFHIMAMKKDDENAFFKYVLQFFFSKKMAMKKED